MRTGLFNPVSLPAIRKSPPGRQTVPGPPVYFRPLPSQPIFFGNENSVTSPARLLFEGIEKGDVEAVGRALSRLDRVDMTNPKGHTPIQAVIYSPSVREKVAIEDACQILLALLAKGADPNEGIQGYTYTPLIWLVERFGENPQAVFETVKSFLEKGADVDVYRTVADHPVKVFLSRGNPGKNKTIATRLLKLLLDKEPVVSHMASAKVLNEVAKGVASATDPKVREDWPEGLELLLNFGLEPENNFWSCLSDAVEANLPETFNRLRQDMPKSQESDLLSHCLREAIEKNKPAMAELIFKSGIDFTRSRTANPQTLLERHMMSDTPDADIIRVLVKNGADPSRKASYGNAYSVLHGLAEGTPHYEIDTYGMGFAVLSGHTEWPEGIEAVLEATQINLDSPGKDRITPLMVACRQGHVNIVRKLLEAGANPTLKNYTGDNALVYLNGNTTIPENKKRMIRRLLEEAIQSWKGPQTK